MSTVILKYVLQYTVTVNCGLETQLEHSHVVEIQFYLMTIKLLLYHSIHMKNNQSIIVAPLTLYCINNSFDSDQQHVSYDIALK